MIILVCTDESGGMLFHRRRQSQDRILRDKILALTGDSVLWMNAYSYGQFQQEGAKNLRVDEEFLQKAAEGEFCFVEDKPLNLEDERIEGVIRYCWNRTYPADLFLDEKKLRARFLLAGRKEFAGYSHEKITQEVYVR